MKASVLSFAASMLAFSEVTAVGLAGQTDFEAASAATRLEVNFNGGWLFCGRDIANGQAGGLDESEFKPVCLPHATSLVKRHSIDTSDGARVTWYRKRFVVPQQFEGRRFFIEFQGVSKAAQVFCNGKPIGEHKGAYTPFTFDMTDFVRIGTDNVLAVRVDSRQRKDVPPEGANVDFMTFGGIVRNVRMVITNPLHVDWVYARCDSARPGFVMVNTRVVNAAESKKTCVMTSIMTDSSGKAVAAGSDTKTISADSAYIFSLVLGPVANPRLWNPDYPYLYTIHTNVADGPATIDKYGVRFGMRSISFNITDGTFSINGRPLKLRGLNRHETYPFIGRAAADRLQAKDADIIKYDFGCNIVRCSHYPQAPAFLDRCDEIGLLVLEEMPGWLFVSEKSAWQALALASVKEMILRDRNHPSIISFGVRINESADFHGLYVKTNKLARSLDPGRPTHGVRVLDRGRTGEFLEDVWCQNFAIPKGKPPVMPWITTEAVGHHYGAVHSWDDDSRTTGQMLAHAAALDSAAANPYIAGLLGWCAFDYYSPYRYAEKSVCYHGVADIFRIPKHAAYLYKSQADPAIYGPTVYIAHSWKKALKPTNDVWVSSNCQKVELFVNGASRGKHSPDKYLSLAHPLFVWNNIAFEAGEIKAVGFMADTVAATYIRKTPKTAVRLSLTPDDTVLRVEGDMTRFIATAVDASGQVASFANNLVTIALSGNADFLGESPIPLENGTTAFFVKTREKGGSVSCKVTSMGLTGASVRIQVK